MLLSCRPDGTSRWYYSVDGTSDRIRRVEETILIAGVVLGLALWIEDWWHRNRFRKRLKDILREHLTDPRWNWRTFEGLGRAIHADKETTRELLIEIGARPSE